MLSPHSPAAMYQAAYVPCLAQVERNISLYAALPLLEYFAQLSTSYSSFPWLLLFAYYKEYFYWNL